MYKNEKGFSLIEILISLAILGALGAGVFWALGTGVKTLSGTDEAGTARNIAESQLDYVKSLPYNAEGIYAPSQISEDFPGYAAEIVAAEIAGKDENIQRLTIIVSYRGGTVTSLEGYKIKP